MKFSIAETVPSGVVALAAAISSRPDPHNTLSIVDRSGSYYGNTITTPQLYSDDNPPIVNGAPLTWQVNISDKVLYDDLDEIDTVILDYEYQFKYDHYDEASPDDTITLSYLGGGPITGIPYIIEYSSNVDSRARMWKDYDDNGGSMYQRYNTNLTWSTIPPTGVTEYRCRLILSEDIISDETICVRYDKVVKVSSGSTIDKSVDVTSTTEIVNARRLYTYGTDYSFSFSPDTISLSGKLSGTTPWVKRSKLANVSVAMPGYTDRDGWFPKVWAGVFKDVDGNVYRVPEYNTQQDAHCDFRTGSLVTPRCGIVSYDRCDIIDKRSIAMQEHPIHYWTDGYPDYEVYSMYDPLYNDLDYTSSSNYSHGITICINGSKMDQSNIRDIDDWNGILYLNNDLIPNSDVRATYAYEMRYYTIQYPDMCPQVHHVGLSYGSGDSLVGIPTGDSVVAVMIPDGGLAWHYRYQNPTYTYGTGVYGYSTVISSSPPSSPTVALPTGTLVLCELSVMRGDPDVVTKLYDARSRGGGLYSDEYYPITRLDKLSRELVAEESIHYADIGMYDGIGLKKDGVIVVKVPMEKILEIRDAIVRYRMDTIKYMASQMRDIDIDLTVDDSIVLATNEFRDYYAYPAAISAVIDAAERNTAGGTMVVLVDENMEVI